MGPDEYATREELDVSVRFLLAKIHQQGQLIVMLSELLISQGILAESAVLEMGHQLERSAKTLKMKSAREKLEEFLTIHNIGRLLQDPPQE